MGDGFADSQRGARSALRSRRADSDLKKLEPQIGRALRSVYDETVSETIPDEMLELLGKLG